jgi:hypothetical protein
MATLTRSVIVALEHDPELYDTTLAEVVALMRQEQALADRLERGLRTGGIVEMNGWIDWPEVIGYFRERATAEYMRNELRRNQRISRRDAHVSR